MIMKCNGSGSSGNGYALIADHEILLLECGVPVKEMLNLLSYRTSDVAGCLVSHQHGDHSKYIRDYTKYGIKVFTSKEVSRDILTVYGERTTGISRMKKHLIGNFTVIPFSVPHNETECDGFLIIHNEFGKLLFITDAEYCPYDFTKSGINHAMIECNYSEDYLTKYLENYGHVLRGHMELKTCKRLVQSLSNQSLRNVCLLHLSGGNSDSVRFEKEIKEMVDCDVNVMVAGKGLATELSLEPF